MSPSQIYRWACCHWWWLPVAWPCLGSPSLSPGNSAGYHGGSVGFPPPPRRPTGTSTPLWALCPRSLHPGSQFTQPWTPRRTTAVSRHSAPSPESPPLWRLWYQWRLRWPPYHRHLWSWPHQRQLWRSVTHLQTSHWTPRVKVGKMGFTLTRVCRDRPLNPHPLVPQCLRLGQCKILVDFFALVRTTGLFLEKLVTLVLPSNSYVHWCLNWSVLYMAVNAITKTSVLEDSAKPCSNIFEIVAFYSISACNNGMLSYGNILVMKMKLWLR